MARAGVVNKTDVRNARAALIKRGENPSADAILAITGGSKSTVIKYLQQLKREESGKEGVSQAIQDLAAKLADQVYAEAQEEAKALRSELDEQARRHADALAAAQRELDALRAQLQDAAEAQQTEQGAHAATREALQREAIARHTAEQQVADLRERLADRDKHCDTLEQNLRDARAALEHYRESVREQREQDTRQRQQRETEFNVEIQRLRQDLVARQADVTRLNREAADITAELTQARKGLRDAEEQSRRHAAQIETLQQRAAVLAAQLQEKDGQLHDLLSQFEAGRETLTTAQLQLATANATLAAQNDLVAELRARIEDRMRETPAPGTAAQPTE